MPAKLFVMDMDGTLIGSLGRISERNKEALRAAANAGVIVTIATGRMYASALPTAKELGIDVPLITYNGALIKSVSGKVLYESCLNADYVREVLDFCIERGWHIQLYNGDELYFTEHNDYAKGYERLSGIAGHVVGMDIYKHTYRVSKMLSITDGADETDMRVAELRKAFGGRLFPVKSNPNYAEIIGIGVNKASGIKRLAKVLGISLSDTVAIGDSNNDMPMLKAAGMGVAMGNAVPEVKASADAVVSSVDDDGVAEAVYEYVL